MTPNQWAQLGAVILFVASLIRGMIYIMDRIEAIARRVNLESLIGFREAMAEGASDLRQGMSGIQAEVALLRADFHNLNTRTTEHDREIGIIRTSLAAFQDFCRYTHGSGHGREPSS